MQKSILKEVILEQEKDRQNVDASIPRTVLDKALKYASLPHAVVVSGIRRCGKSTLSRQVLNQHYKDGVYSFNFEDERLINFTAEDFNSL